MSMEYLAKSHLNLRGRSIKTITEDIAELQDEIELLYGIGLRLYDISVTIPGLSRVNNDVKSAYDAASVYFDTIRPDTPKEEQEYAVNNFFIKLGNNL